MPKTVQRDKVERSPEWSAADLRRLQLATIEYTKSACKEDVPLVGEDWVKIKELFGESNHSAQTLRRRWCAVFAPARDDEDARIKFNRLRRAGLITQEIQNQLETCTRNRSCQLSMLQTDLKNPTANWVPVRDRERKKAAVRSVSAGPEPFSSEQQSLLESSNSKKQRREVYNLISFQPPALQSKESSIGTRFMLSGLKKPTTRTIESLEGKKHVIKRRRPTQDSRFEWSQLQLPSVIHERELVDVSLNDVASVLGIELSSKRSVSKSLSNIFDECLNADEGQRGPYKKSASKASVKKKQLTGPKSANVAAGINFHCNREISNGFFAPREDKTILPKTSKICCKMIIGSQPHPTTLGVTRKLTKSLPKSEKPLHSDHSFKEWFDSGIMSFSKVDFPRRPYPPRPKKVRLLKSKTRTQSDCSSIDADLPCEVRDLYRVIGKANVGADQENPAGPENLCGAEAAENPKNPVQSIPSENATTQATPAEPLENEV